MTVKVFRSTDYGAPTNTNAIGSVIAILDACLVNGYGSQTPTSITRSGTTATVTVPVAHGLLDGAFVRISGANQADYNGDFAITVTSTTTFTYQVTNSPASPATGTLVSKVAPANWTKPFTGTNIAAFKQGAGSNGMYLKVTDTATTAARVKGCEAMTSITTSTGDFPTETQVPSGLYIIKSTTASAFAWEIVADEKMLHFFINGSQYRTLTCFGDIISNKSGDAFNTILNSAASSSATNSDAAQFNSTLSSSATLGHYIARPYTQIGTSLANANFSSKGVGQATFGGSGSAIPYPSQIDGALHISKIECGEGTAGFRGTLQGLWNPLFQSVSELRHYYGDRC